MAPAPAPAHEPDWVALERATVDRSLPLCNDAPPLFDRPCRAVGIYILSTIGSKGPAGSVLAVWPMLVVTPHGSLLLGSLWFPEDLPDPETRVRYEGKRVEVTGVLRREPPHKDPTHHQNIMATTLHPVHAIRVLGDAP